MNKQWTPEERLDVIKKLADKQDAYIRKYQSVDASIAFDVNDAILRLATASTVFLNNKHREFSDLLARLQDELGE